MTPDDTPMTDAHAAVERIYREEYGRVVASLVRRFGDIDLAEDAAAEGSKACRGKVEVRPFEGVV